MVVERNVMPSKNGVCGNIAFSWWSFFFFRRLWLKAGTLPPSIFAPTPLTVVTLRKHIYIVFALNSVFLLSSLRENIDIISRMELSVKHLQSTHTGAAYSYHEPHLAEDLNKGNRSRVKTERLGLLVNYILA